MKVEETKQNKILIFHGGKTNNHHLKLKNQEVIYNIQNLTLSIRNRKAETKITT